jgi:LPS export ABC transporter protein LptC
LKNNIENKWVKAAALACCLFLCACENDEQTVNKLFQRKVGREEAKEVVITFTTAGKTKAILTAPIMYRIEDTVSYIEFPKTLEVNFYNEEGIAESKLTAMYARYKENENIVFLRDSVKVVNIKGETLDTEEMYWDRSRTGYEFYTEKPVRIKTLTQILFGVGMEASQDFKTRHIKQSTGTIQIPKSQFPM